MKGFQANLVSLVLMSIITLYSCESYKGPLFEAEQLLETNPAAADSILTSMPAPQTNRNRAWYAVLKTQADYKQYKPISSDSLILIATRYYGNRHKNYHSAMAWYTQGCVYTEMNNDVAAVESFLMAKDLFPDTLLRSYALTEQNIGRLYLKKMMYGESIELFSSCLINAFRLGDKQIELYSKNNIGLAYLYLGNYLESESIFNSILCDSSIIINQKRDVYLHLAKLNLYYKNDIDAAVLYAKEYIASKNKRVASGAAFSLLGSAYYKMNELDSAYYYLKECLACKEELYTVCSASKLLAEVSIIKGYSDEALGYFNKYTILMDSIQQIERAKDIEVINNEHHLELLSNRLKERNRRIVIIGISIVIMILVLLILKYNIDKKREYQRILKQKEALREKEIALFQQQEELRKNSISLLEKHVRNMSCNNPEARDVLLQLYVQKIETCFNSFRYTREYQLICSSKVLSFDVINREAIITKIENTYQDIIRDIFVELPGVEMNEALTLVLASLHCSNELSSLIVGNITAEAIRKRKYRFKKSNPDFCSLFY